VSSRPASALAAAGLAFSLALPVHAEELKVESTEVRLSATGAVVLLRVGKRAIPVFVDPIVGESIQAALDGRKPVRPLTHDLMHNVLAGFDGRVTKVVVTLHEGIFYGALTVALRGTSKVFDSRSSDAIALAIHAGAPILVSRQLLDSAGIELEATK
jgi:bifunctional DNase/RNase